MLHPLISDLILETERINDVKGSNLCSMYPALQLPAVINLARSSQGEEFPLFQNFRSSKTS